MRVFCRVRPLAVPPAPAEGEAQPTRLRDRYDRERQERETGSAEKAAAPGKGSLRDRYERERQEREAGGAAAEAAPAEKAPAAPADAEPVVDEFGRVRRE